MNDSIETEVIRLLKDIAQDERELLYAETQAEKAFSESYKQKYRNEAERCRKAINRKMELIKILKL